MPLRPEERLARRGGAIELLRLPAAVFGAVARLRGALYDRGWLPVERLDAPVVSVGNLTAGGTGKTPVVAWLAGELARRGLRPGLVSRGYGAHDAQDSSDEALLLRRLLPDVPHVQDPDRVRGARALVERGCDAVVLDDAFQHRRLARDLDLLLVDATRPWGLPPPAEGGRAVAALLPRGLLREPPAALARAHAVVITRVDQAGGAQLEALRAQLAELAPGAPILLSRHRSSGLRRVGGRERAAALELAGRRVELLSGIGNPDAFEASVLALGAEVTGHRRFPDHHAYQARDLARLGAGGQRVVTTAKDAVKLEELARAGPPDLWSLEVEIAFDEGRPVLEALLDALPEARARVQRRALHEGLAG